jgi:hypothetical protein
MSVFWWFISWCHMRFTSKFIWSDSGWVWVIFFHKSDHVKLSLRTAGLVDLTVHIRLKLLVSNKCWTSVWSVLHCSWWFMRHRLWYQTLHRSKEDQVQNTSHSVKLHFLYRILLGWANKNSAVSVIKPLLLITLTPSPLFCPHQKDEWALSGNFRTKRCSFSLPPINKVCPLLLSLLILSLDLKS